MDAPTPDQISGAINATSTAVNAVKTAWADWAAIIPWMLWVATQAAALVKGFADVPGITWIAGTYGHSVNKV